MQTEHNVVPALTFYADFADDWEHFDDKTRAGIGWFLKHLQADPADPDIAKISEKNGGYYATRIGPVVVYWTFPDKNESVENGQRPLDAIYVLAVHSADQVMQ